MPIGAISHIRVPEGRKVDLSQIQLVKNIPKEQTFCEVRIVKYQQVIYALKVIHKNKISSTLFEDEYRRIQAEINVLYELKHPNIIKLYYHQETQEDIFLLMEYGGTRLGGLIRRKQLEEAQISNLAYQILQGLLVIHDNGYIHRDLSTENILVTRENQIKIVDFGFTDEARGRRTALGNLFYMAPEITGDATYNYKIDVWSLGIIVYEMFHQDTPFASRKKFDQKLFLDNRDNFRLNINTQISQEAIDFIKKMIVLNPEKRLDPIDLLKHPFIRQYRGSQRDNSQFFDKLKETQKIERKTMKPNIHLRDKSQRSSKDKDIALEEKQFRKSVGQVFACLHHQRDMLEDLLKTYSVVLERQAQAKNKKG